ncbi:hypothetical protein GGX14DRAFT_540416 [Mycena pura]|uniref:Uncharacterized protein n=1 Tax=Mycena pura TaxID=153505 RepID=A0AAD7E1H1_9AGAR|nr:hypothetical protein GGX14DRAFT_540416 [Mycena pura]
MLSWATLLKFTKLTIWCRIDFFQNYDHIPIGSANMMFTRRPQKKKLQKSLDAPSLCRGIWRRRSARAASLFSTFAIVEMPAGILLSVMGINNYVMRKTNAVLPFSAVYAALISEAGVRPPFVIPRQDRCHVMYPLQPLAEFKSEYGDKHLAGSAFRQLLASARLPLRHMDPSTLPPSSRYKILQRRLHRPLRPRSAPTSTRLPRGLSYYDSFRLRARGHSHCSVTAHSPHHAQFAKQAQTVIVSDSCAVDAAAAGATIPQLASTTFAISPASGTLRFIHLQQRPDGFMAEIVPIIWTFHWEPEVAGVTFEITRRSRTLGNARTLVNATTRNAGSTRLLIISLSQNLGTPMPIDRRDLRLSSTPHIAAENLYRRLSSTPHIAAKHPQCHSSSQGIPFYASVLSGSCTVKPTKSNNVFKTEAELVNEVEIGSARRNVPVNVADPSPASL